MSSIEEIFEEIENALIRLDILIFFSKNPYAMDTASKFSDWLKRPLSDVARGLDYFVQNGIVEKIGDGENAIYSYTSNFEITSKIDEFLKGLSKGRRA